MRLQEWQIYLSFIKDLVTVFATVIGGCIAIYGLVAWKRQLKGKTEYELARRILRAVYKVRDAIKGVRNPLQSAGEIETSLREAGLSIDPNSSEYHLKSATSVYQRRWNKLNEARSDLQVELLEAEVSWGSEIIDTLKPLNECISELYVNIMQYLDGLNDPFPCRTEDADQRNNRIKIIYEISADPNKDPFSGKIKCAVEELERYLKPHLRL